MCYWMMNQCAQLSLPLHFHSLFFHHTPHQTYRGLLPWFVCSPCCVLYWKHGAEYVSGLTRPCYSCKISYTHWIYSMGVLISMHLALHVCVVDAHAHPAKGVMSLMQHSKCVTRTLSLSCCHFYKLVKKIYHLKDTALEMSVVDVTGWLVREQQSVFIEMTSDLCWRREETNCSICSYWTGSIPPWRINWIQQLRMKWNVIKNWLLKIGLIVLTRD